MGTPTHNTIAARDAAHAQERRTCGQESGEGNDFTLISNQFIFLFLRGISNQFRNNILKILNDRFSFSRNSKKVSQNTHVIYITHIRRSISKISLLSRWKLKTIDWPQEQKEKMLKRKLIIQKITSFSIKISQKVVN